MQHVAICDVVWFPNAHVYGSRYVLRSRIVDVRSTVLSLKIHHVLINLNVWINVQTHKGGIHFHQIRFVSKFQNKWVKVVIYTVSLQ
jgi:hypothetical protein